MSLSREDFTELAAILSDVREALQQTDNANMAKHGMNVETNALVFSRFMADVRKFCKSRNPNFSTERFDSAVYGSDTSNF